MDFVRLALTSDQVEDLNLSHAKRATKIKPRSAAEDSVVAMGWPRGSRSVELDAIPQATLQEILQASIVALIDADAWAKAKAHREARASEMSVLVDGVLGFIGQA
jgi:actin-like ATPase involved in cell morphogenesis